MKYQTFKVIRGYEEVNGASIYVTRNSRCDLKDRLHTSLQNTNITKRMCNTYKL